MATRSNFLVHWTGRSIQTDREALTDGQRTAFVERLVDILSRGLWMTRPIERLIGQGGSFFDYDVAMTCFTEIRLSQTYSHYARYGLLGVGVTRQFVLDRWGGPVLYVRNSVDECLVANVHAIFSALVPAAKNGNVHPSVLDRIHVLASFMKNMSDPQRDNFVYLDELEWRIVNIEQQETRGHLVRTGLHNPELRIPLRSEDVRIVVFPDSVTRSQAIKDARIKFSDEAILLTVEECEQF